MEAFIKKKGVTKCPGMFSQELAEHNARLTLEYNAMTPEQRKAYHKAKFSWKRGRRSDLTPEQRKAKNAAYQRSYYRKKKGLV